LNISSRVLRAELYSQRHSTRHASDQTVLPEETPRYDGRKSDPPCLPSSRWPPCPRLGGALALRPGPTRRKSKIHTKSTRELSLGHAPLLSQAKVLGCASLCNFSDLVIPFSRAAHCQKINRGVKKATVRKKVVMKWTRPCADRLQ
jgi:hypothetical protein